MNIIAANLVQRKKSPSFLHLFRCFSILEFLSAIWRSVCSTSTIFALTWSKSGLEFDDLLLFVMDALFCNDGNAAQIII